MVDLYVMCPTFCPQVYELIKKRDAVSPAHEEWKKLDAEAYQAQVAEHTRRPDKDKGAVAGGASSKTGGSMPVGASSKTGESSTTTVLGQEVVRPWSHLVYPVLRDKGAVEQPSEEIFKNVETPLFRACYMAMDKTTGNSKQYRTQKGSSEFLFVVCEDGRRGHPVYLRPGCCVLAKIIDEFQRERGVFGNEARNHADGKDR